MSANLNLSLILLQMHAEIANLGVGQPGIITVFDPHGFYMVPSLKDNGCVLCKHLIDPDL